MVAASKMRKAQERATMARPYAGKIREVLGHLSSQIQPEDEIHPLLVRRPIDRSAIIHMTSDKGLCGGLNANINRVTDDFIQAETVSFEIITVGKKGRDFMRRTGHEICADFTNMVDQPSINDILPIAKIVMEDYASGMIDSVSIAYPKFVSTAVQQPTIVRLLPVEPAEIPRGENVDYIYEPGAASVLGGLLPRFVEMEVYHAILESIASEQSARMVAMKNATDSANELIDYLTLEYNKARQDAITTELLDITGGVTALE